MVRESYILKRFGTTGNGGFLNNINLILSLSVCVFFAQQANGATKDVGVFGRVYQIKEDDAITEVQRHASLVDWKKVFGKTKDTVKNYQPKDLTSPLPVAKTKKSFLVDVTGEFPHDIPDGKGGIVYPAGTRINPLDVITYPNTLVVIDPTDRRQLEWFKKSEFAKRTDVRLLISGKGYYETSKGLRRPVFYATSQITDKFKIKAVPSVIYQEGNKMRVDEHPPVATTKKEKGSP